MGRSRDRTRGSALRQVGALCWRDLGTGTEVLLITSRGTGRWVIPKGGRMSGLPDDRAAAQEALEEAGVAGELGAGPLGSYTYRKHLSGRSSRLAVVDVYPLKVTAEFDTWKEARERTRRWFRPEAAADAVAEPDLKGILTGFRP